MNMCTALAQCSDNDFPKKGKRKILIKTDLRVRNSRRGEGNVDLPLAWGRKEKSESRSQNLLRQGWGRKKDKDRSAHRFCKVLLNPAQEKREKTPVLVAPGLLFSRVRVKREIKTTGGTYRDRCRTVFDCRGEKKKRCVCFARLRNRRAEGREKIRGRSRSQGTFLPLGKKAFILTKGTSHGKEKTIIYPRGGKKKDRTDFAPSFPVGS